MAIRFFFEYDNQVIQLPVNPEELTIESSGNNATEDIVKLGEINLLKDKRLLGCTITGFLPTDSALPYVVTSGQFEPPEFYLDFFETVRQSKKPMRFIVSDTKINMLVAIENLVYGLKAGDDDTHYELELKEYRPYSAKQVIIKTPEPTSEEVAPAPSIEIPPEQRPPTGFAIGDQVIANGRYWYTSYGDSPFGTFYEFVGLISHLVADTSRPYRYHITDLEGGYMGWVDESQIRH